MIEREREREELQQTCNNPTRDRREEEEKCKGVRNPINLTSFVERTREEEQRFVVIFLSFKRVF